MYYLDFNLVKSLAVVHTNDASNHLRDNDHVPKVSPHRFRFLSSRRLAFLLEQDYYVRKKMKHFS
jgi:hypothetical protein